MFAASQIAVVAIAALLAVPVLVLSVQIFSALPRVTPARRLDTPRPRVAVLVPAHDEESVIGETLDSICRQLDSGDRLLVVADNCSDRTADIAKQHGAEVSVRSDADRRGKGYALDHGLDVLRRTGAAEVIIFIDADCQLNDGCIDRLARISINAGRPVQAAYLMNPPQPPRPTASIVCFAWTVKDFVRPLGWHRLGLPCQLAGSGMAIPWALLQSVDLRSGHLAEDLKLGLDLALTGSFPQFCPEAVVRSNVAPGGAPSGSQRARWEHGSMETMLHYVPRLVARWFRAPSVSLIAMTLDLTVPPIALLALALGIYLVTAAAAFALLGLCLPIVLSAGTCALFVVAIGLAWLRYGRDVLPLRWLLLAPFYALRKAPLYVAFLVNRQREWVRGQRAKED